MIDSDLSGRSDRNVLRLGAVISLTMTLIAFGAFGKGRIPVMGYQLDVSRSKVPTMRSLYRMVDIISSLGYNQFQLYTEHTFAYSAHETVWREASPMTPDEIRSLDAYCVARGIELVPNQNSFGHLENWLMHPEYNVLAECPSAGAVYKKWNFVSRRAMSLCPGDPRSLVFLAGLYDELLPCFRSKFLNVGCDETLELLDDNVPPLGRSSEDIQARGPHRVYLDFLKKIHGLVAARGHTMMFWGDIILGHPELISELPKDVICLNWGYEADHPFERETSEFEKAGCKFYVCPGTSTWSSLFGRLTNMMGNIDNAVAAAEKHGASGVLLTDWGDTGHPHPWISSLPSLIYLSHRRNGETLTRDQLAAEIDRVTGVTCGKSLMRIGDIYLKVGGRIGNTAELDPLLRQGKDYRRSDGVTDASIAAGLGEWRMSIRERDLSDAPDWVADGFAMFDLLGEAVSVRVADPKKVNFRATFEPRYRALWLKHNRPGGLTRSITEVFGR